MNNFKTFLKKNKVELTSIAALFILLFQPINMTIRLFALTFGFFIVGGFIGFRKNGITGAIIGIIIGLIALFILVESQGGMGGLNYIIS